MAISGTSLTTSGLPSDKDSSTRPPFGVTSVSPSRSLSPTFNSLSSPSALRACARTLMEVMVAMIAVAMWVTFFFTSALAIKTD